jgi:hypothetical protein
MSFIPERFAYERLDDLASDFIVSGRTAAILHKIADYRLGLFEFSHKGRRQSRSNHIKFRNVHVPEADIVILSGLPVTSKSRTISDLVKANDDISSLNSESIFSED